jgi:predicted nucleic acid-binding protein
MRLVVDANILVGELIRARGRELIARRELELYIAESAWEEACHELSKRITTMVKKEVFSQEVGQNLLASAIALAEVRVSLVPLEVYADYEAIALSRIPRDPNDWSTVALALVLNAGIWTNDKDFLGCGLPTWITETLLSYLPNKQ